MFRGHAIAEIDSRGYKTRQIVRSEMTFVVIESVARWTISYLKIQLFRMYRRRHPSALLRAYV